MTGWPESLRRDLRAALAEADTEAAPPLHDVPMRGMTTFRIGGPADALCAPRTPAGVSAAIRFARTRQLPVTILGKGSNILVADAGIRGLVIALAENYAGIRAQEDLGGIDADQAAEALEQARDAVAVPLPVFMYARAGCSLAEIAGWAARKSLGGLEFACGIPGTLGGAVLMNAGAYGPSMADVVVASDYLDDGLEPARVCGDGHDFAYRRSRFSGGSGIILGSLIRVVPADPTEIRARMADLAERRRTSQPLDLPSAGSVFKRPPGNFAGKLIGDCRLQGRRRGDAEVSAKHAGFIVNLGQATAADVLGLILDVRRTVFLEQGVLLEPEVRRVGDWGLEDLSVWQEPDPGER